MKEQFKNIIYNWVKENFGESEADDPSWNIDALAGELNKHFYELYYKQELEFLKQDVENYINDSEIDGKKIELTEKQKYAIAEKIKHSDLYCNIDPTDMGYYIKEELKRKGE